MIVISQYFFNFLNVSVVVQLQDCQPKLDYDQINTLKKTFDEKFFKTAKWNVQFYLPSKAHYLKI